MNAGQSQVQKNKASGKGCLIALAVFGAILAVSVVVGGIIIYQVLNSPQGRKIVTAVADTAKLTQEAMNAPGTPELRKLGCDQALVMDTERMLGIIQQFTPDSGAKAELSEKTMVMCQLTSFGKAAPSCEDVAKTYLAAATPPADFLVQVAVQGDSKPKCQKRYSQAGIDLDP